MEMEMDFKYTPGLELELKDRRDRFRLQMKKELNSENGVKVLENCYNLINQRRKEGKLL